MGPCVAWCSEQSQELSARALAAGHGAVVTRLSHSHIQTFKRGSRAGVDRRVSTFSLFCC
jgi:hypothetical protein